MLTIAHADRGKPTLQDDERPFRYGLFRDLKMNANMNAKSMPVSYSMNRPCKVYFFSTKQSKKSALLYICKNIILPPSSKTAS